MVATQLVLNVRTKIGQAIARQEAQGLVEYALIIVLVAIAVIIAVMALGTQLQTVFKTIVNNLSTAS
jgi:Flp pilus assembly pilin Flp